MGADGSQLCVWPGLWLRVRPGRDREMEDRRREERRRRRRHSLAPMNSWGVGMEDGKRKRRASLAVPMKSVPGRFRPARGKRRSQPSWI